jgi:hypothetical protein
VRVHPALEPPHAGQPAIVRLPHVEAGADAPDIRSDAPGLVAIAVGDDNDPRAATAGGVRQPLADPRPASRHHDH